MPQWLCHTENFTNKDIFPKYFNVFHSLVFVPWDSVSYMRFTLYSHSLITAKLPQNLTPCPKVDSSQSALSKTLLNYKFGQHSISRASCYFFVKIIHLCITVKEFALWLCWHVNTIIAHHHNDEEVVGCCCIKEKMEHSYHQTQCRCHAPWEAYHAVAQRPRRWVQYQGKR